MSKTETKTKTKLRVVILPGDTPDKAVSITFTDDGGFYVEETSCKSTSCKVETNETNETKDHSPGEPKACDSSPDARLDETGSRQILPNYDQPSVLRQGKGYVC